MSTAWPRPRSRLFLGLLRVPLHCLPGSPPWVCTAPALRSAPPPPHSSPSFGCSHPGSAPSRLPPRLQAPGSRLLAPGRPSLGPCFWCRAPCASRSRHLASLDPVSPRPQPGPDLFLSVTPLPSFLSLFSLACLLPAKLLCRVRERQSSFAGKSQKPLQKADNEI